MDGAAREENIRLSRRCQTGVFILGLSTVLLISFYSYSSPGPPNLRATFLMGFYAVVMTGGPLAIALTIAAFSYARGFEVHELSRRLALCFLVTLILVVASVVAWYDVLVLR